MGENDCKWEFQCPTYVDFHSEFDDTENSQDEWFDIDHENDTPCRSVPRSLTAVKSPLKEINNVQRQSTNELPVIKNIVTDYNLKKWNGLRAFHLKTARSVGRQTEIKRRSMGKPNKSRRLSSSSSVCSKNKDQDDSFVSNLRKYDSPDPEKSYVPKNTIPVPFNFSRPPTQKYAAEEFRSIAQQVIAYQTTTPLRFRLKPRTATPDDMKPTIYSTKKSCVPRSPPLQTKTRTRPSHVQSQQELDEVEFEKMKNYHFHAQPVKKDIFRRSYCELPLKQVKGSTVMKPFHFHTHAPAKPPKMSFSDVQSTFRARAVPTDILQRPVGIPRIPKRPAVVVQPFTFADYDKQRQKKKEQKIQEYYEEERRLREFRANPLPDLQVKGLPEKQPKAKTVIQPFDFIANHKELNHLGKKRFEAEIERINSVPKFKARPMLQSSPFIPKKPNRFLTSKSFIHKQAYTHAF
ncbi:Protein tpx2, variant 2 [Chamberlinius hualienensis]